ncbi:MAG: hypothetical protein JXM79_00760 [Sedimentisphaerales bacterium]|nr:hypothetical protein [Sedimentisphaerales bacterium]
MKTLFPVMGFILLGLVTPLIQASQKSPNQWIRPSEENRLIWGIKGGIVLAIWPSGFHEANHGGPRGLFRLGYERNGKMMLVNFVAVEPVVANKRCFSELELSTVPKQAILPKQKRGKFIWPSSEYPPATTLEKAATIEQMRSQSVSGWLTQPSPGVEQLNVAFDVEKFNNGAHPWIVASIRNDRPDEIIFTIHAAPDSAPMQQCILTATMGNYIRARQLWLRDRVVFSKALWPDPMTAGVKAIGFTRPEFFEEDLMSRMKDGSVIVMIATDEKDPTKTAPKPTFWHYKGLKVTQYWRAYPHKKHPLRIKVNGRFTYWMSRNPIPNGVAFENFELVQDYYDGQQFIFGITERLPDQFELKKASFLTEDR